MIPFGLLAGLLTLWAARELLDVLPGSGRVTEFLLCAPVLALPAMVAAWLAHRQRALNRAARAPWGVRAVPRVSSPACSMPLRDREISDSASGRFP